MASLWANRSPTECRTGRDSHFQTPDVGCPEIDDWLATGEAIRKWLKCHSIAVPCPLGTRCASFSQLILLFSFRRDCRAVTPAASTLRGMCWAEMPRFAPVTVPKCAKSLSPTFRRGAKDNMNVSAIANSYWSLSETRVGFVEEHRWHSRLAQCLQRPAYSNCLCELATIRLCSVHRLTDR